MIKKIKFGFFFSLITISLFASSDNSFKDIDYLSEKFKIRHTIEQLDKLKKIYDINSKEYNYIQELEGYFLKKIPIDAYGTYTRIKIHNIIDNSNVIKKKVVKKYKILKSNTDLNSLYYNKYKDNKDNKTTKKINNNNNFMNESKYKEILNKFKSQRNK